MKLEKRIELCDSMTPLESEIASYILNKQRCDYETKDSRIG